MKIIQVGEKWQFGSEYDLEEFAWKNLGKLLGLKPFKRQYSIRGQFCDILALDEDKHLSIIELKNSEDRYIVQQLTRYYDALLEEKPFQSEANLSDKIRLIAIAPSFHRDTIVDCKYNALNFELCTFSIKARGSILSLHIHHKEVNLSSSLRLSQVPDLQTVQDSQEIPDPPRKLLNWLAHQSQSEFNGFLEVRKQILGFDSRMKEIVETQRIIYGRGKTKPCAEIRQVRDFNSSKFPRLILWLPDLEDKPHTLRMQVGIQENWKAVSSMGYSPASTKIKRVWHFPACIDYMQRIGYRSSLKLYKKVMSPDGKTCIPSKLVSLALETWKTRF